LSGFRLLAIAVLAASAAALAYLYAGLYPVGADVPHSRLTYWLLDSLRERSVRRAAKDIEVPDLDQPARLLAGGPDYHEMCSGCHLRPGRQQSDRAIGLYPRPPDLTKAAVASSPGRRFWIIKHGIKASGMPAWGPTHDDERIWNMVAFLQRLPELTPDQYQILTARGTTDAGHH